jgi:hypothetical protein
MTARSCRRDPAALAGTTAVLLDDGLRAKLEAGGCVRAGLSWAISARGRRRCYRRALGRTAPYRRRNPGDCARRKSTQPTRGLGGYSGCLFEPGFGVRRDPRRYAVTY